VLKLHRISPQLAGHSTASRPAKEAGSRTVVRDIQNPIVAVRAHRSVQPQAATSQRSPYLLGMPLLADYLGEALSQFGHSCDE
jgi:hypothetical protein